MDTKENSNTKYRSLLRKPRSLCYIKGEFRNRKMFQFQLNATRKWQKLAPNKKNQSNAIAKITSCKIEKNLRFAKTNSRKNLVQHGSRCTGFDSAFLICFPACRCNKQGSTKLTCDEETGRCSCKTGVRGRKCDECPSGFYGFPKCQRTLSKKKC